MQKMHAAMIYPDGHYSYLPGQDAEVDEQSCELVRGLKRDLPLAVSKGLIARLEKMAK